MQKPKLLYYTMLKFQPDNLELLKQNFDVTILNNPSEDTSEILEQIEVVYAPLGYFLGKEKINDAKNLRVIASNTTGVPHIDVDYAKEKKIEVISLAGEREFLDTITPVSELTWGLIISLMRHIPQAFNFVLEGNWDRRPFGGRSMLSRMSIGIVGLGRLGLMVAKQAKAFGMEIYYYDHSVISNDSSFIKLNSLKELVGVSDIVTVHIPANERNNGIFDKEMFSHFKRGSYFINTSRGELLDWEVLLENLTTKHLAGAALDVFEGEFDPNFLNTFKNHPVLEYAKVNDNLLIVPHIGGSTMDAWFLTERHTINLVLSYLSNQKLKNKLI